MGTIDFHWNQWIPSNIAWCKQAFRAHYRKISLIDWPHFEGLLISLATKENILLRLSLQLCFFNRSCFGSICTLMQTEASNSSTRSHQLLLLQHQRRHREDELQPCGSISIDKGARRNLRSRRNEAVPFPGLWVCRINESVSVKKEKEKRKKKKNREIENMI